MPPCMGIGRVGNGKLGSGTLVNFLIYQLPISPLPIYQLTNLHYLSILDMNYPLRIRRDQRIVRDEDHGDAARLV